MSINSANLCDLRCRPATMIAFLDTEFTDLLHPELLSLGIVTLDGREHYVELDLGTEIGRARVKASSDFVRYGGVLDHWGLIPGATATEWEIGRRTGEWLLELAGEAEDRIEVAFDYSVDYELMEYAIRDAGLWEWVREIVLPVNMTHSPAPYRESWLRRIAIGRSASADCGAIARWRMRWRWKRRT
jgi:hypothetical protein